MIPDHLNLGGNTRHLLQDHILKGRELRDQVINVVVDRLEQRLHTIPTVTDRVAAHRIKPLDARHLLFPVDLHDPRNEAVRHIAIRSRIGLLLQLRILHVVSGDTGTQFGTLACAVGHH